MAGAAGVDNVVWKTCEVDGCIGVSPEDTKGCLAHDEQHRDATLQRLGADGQLDARGTTITADLLQQILAATPHDGQGRPVLTAQFTMATFRGRALFNRVVFKDGVDFTRATFQGTAGFQRATFQGTAWFTGVTFQGHTAFTEATFDDRAGFGGVVFEDHADFNPATFVGSVGFTKASFRRGANFGQATFKRWTDFFGATFEDGTNFMGCTIGNAEAPFLSSDDTPFPFDATEVRFENTIFKHRALFALADFAYAARFGGVTFEGVADFREARFLRGARFERATFKSEAEFHTVTFANYVAFEAATFEQARQLGPLVVRKEFVLDESTFKERVQIEVAAARCLCKRTRFLAGAQLRVAWAQIELDDADLAEPSILIGVSSVFSDSRQKNEGLERQLDEQAERFSVGFDAVLDERLLAKEWAQLPRPLGIQEGQPRVVSLRRADVAGLALSNVDLRACRFSGALNLDRLGLESPKAFAATPGLKAVATGWAWPPAWWWTRRQTLAEEHAWRAAHEHGIRQAGWQAGDTWPATTSRWVPNPPRPARNLGRLERHAARAIRAWRRPQRLRRRAALAWRIAATRARVERARRRQALRMGQQQAREVANLYRALRKAREDAKDEPGAADFYYGEMEMRRHAAPRFSVERAVLTGYWLLAGYALRAWRALAALTVALLVAAWLLVHQHGFAEPQAMTFWGALRYGGRTAIGLSVGDQPALTPRGEVLQIAVRIVVPLLLGLAVLSIRGRVKR